MRVIILRGISGSGKSTWVKENASVATVVSADHFFIQQDGTYQFEGTKIHEAHKECYRKFIAALERKDDLIVVDNSNIDIWEFSPYVMLAEVQGYTVEILTLRCDPEIAIQRKAWVAPEKVRRTAKRLDRETQSLPPFMQAMHQVIRTDLPPA